MARVAREAADAKKAENVVVLDLRGITLITDFFVICSAGTVRQVQAISDAVIEKMKEAGVKLLHVEGYERGRWVLLDYGGVVVHVFNRAERDYYRLEDLWGDARVVVDDRQCAVGGESKA